MSGICTITDNWIQTVASSRLVPFTLIAAGNVSAWLSDQTAGSIVSFMTIVVLGGAGLISQALRTVGPALTELRRQREEFLKGSLAAKLDSLNGQLAEASGRIEAANKKLHEAANERHAEVLRHAEEVQMLMEQLRLANEQVKANAARIAAGLQEPA